MKLIGVIVLEFVGNNLKIKWSNYMIYASIGQKYS